MCTCREVISLRMETPYDDSALTKYYHILSKQHPTQSEVCVTYSGCKMGLFPVLKKTSKVTEVTLKNPLHDAIKESLTQQQFG